MISQAQKIGLCLLAVGSVAGVSVGAVAFKESEQVQPVVKATQTTINKNYVKMLFQDQVTWTSSGHDPVIHMWNVVFVSGSGYTSVSDVAETGYTVITNDSAIDVAMTWSSMDGTYRNYVTDLPWYISSFSYKYYVHYTSDEYSTADLTATLGNYKKDYVYDNNHNVSSTTDGTAASKDINAYVLTYKNGDSTLLTKSDVLDKTLYTTGSEEYTMPEAKEFVGWYSDSLLTTEFAAKTKITADTTIYGKFVVTASTFNTWILAFEGGDKTTANCSTNYQKALGFYNSMTIEEQGKFTSANYPEGYARWQAWQRAN